MNARLLTLVFVGIYSLLNEIKQYVTDDTLVGLSLSNQKRSFCHLLLCYILSILTSMSRPSSLKPFISAEEKTMRQ